MGLAGGMSAVSAYKAHSMDQKKCIDSIDFVIVNGEKIIASIDIDQRFLCVCRFRALFCVMSIVCMMAFECVPNKCVCVRVME